MMEASDPGYSALILARAQVQRTPVVILASHTGGGGEGDDLEAVMFRIVQISRAQRLSLGARMNRVEAMDAAAAARGDEVVGGRKSL